MLLITVADGTGTVRHETVRNLPLALGRSPAADIRLQYPGVWDSHAILSADPSRGIFNVESVGAAVVLVNGIPTSSSPLTAGDVLTLGGAQITIALAPPVQVQLGSREAGVWVLLVAVSLLQIFLAATLH